MVLLLLVHMSASRSLSCVDGIAVRALCAHLRSSANRHKGHCNGESDVDLHLVLVGYDSMSRVSWVCLNYFLFLLFPDPLCVFVPQKRGGQMHLLHRNFTENVLCFT